MYKKVNLVSLLLVFVSIMMYGCSSASVSDGMLNSEIFAEKYDESLAFNEIKEDVVELYNLVKVAYDNSDKKNLSSFDIDIDKFDTLYENITNTVDGFSGSSDERVIMISAAKNVAMINKCIAELNLEQAVGVDEDPEWFNATGKELEEVYYDFVGKKSDIINEKDSTPITNSQTTDKKSSVDMETLDATMALTDVLLQDGFGSDYSMVYDQGGVTISFWKEDAAKAAALAKSGNSEAADWWGEMVEATQGMSAQLSEILKQYELSGIPVTVLFFDEQNENSALIIAVDGRVTYDVTK